MLSHDRRSSDVSIMYANFVRSFWVQEYCGDTRHGVTNPNRPQHRATQRNQRRPLTKLRRRDPMSFIHSGHFRRNLLRVP